MGCSIRKLLNFTYGWLFDLIGGTEQWDKEYAHIFDPDKHADFDYVDMPEKMVAPDGKRKLVLGGL